ncbi:MAG: hypothetical protein ACK42Z_06135 [Candidatus Kapaibacteriota bacterium]
MERILTLGEREMLLKKIVLGRKPIDEDDLNFTKKECETGRIPRNGLAKISKEEG